MGSLRDGISAGWDLCGMGSLRDGISATSLGIAEVRRNLLLSGEPPINRPGVRRQWSDFALPISSRQF